jgi:hypothetical protein
MVFNCFGMLIAEIVSAPQGIPLVTLLIFALSLYPVGIMLGGSSCGCCGEQMKCDKCYISSISNSTGVGKFSREQECHACGEFNGNRILRAAGCIIDELGTLLVLDSDEYWRAKGLGMELLMEGPNGNEDPPWYGAIRAWETWACLYTSLILGASGDSNKTGCAFANGKTRFKNAIVYMTLYGPFKEPGNYEKGISVKAIAGYVTYEDVTIRQRTWVYGSIYPLYLLWLNCLRVLGISVNWSKGLQTSYFHGPVTPDSNDNFSVTMSFVAGPKKDSFYSLPSYWYKDYLRDKDCSGSITITSISNPVITPGYEDGGEFATKWCQPCVIPYPGYEFIKDDWNQWEHFGLTQTSISFSGVRTLTHEELCAPEGGWEEGKPRYCPEGDCQCSVWDGKFLTMEDMGKDDPWKDHFTYVTPNCDGINKTIVLDFATNNDVNPFYRNYAGIGYGVSNPVEGDNNWCVASSCLVKEDGSFVRSNKDDFNYIWGRLGLALCEDIGYDSIKYDPYMCILDDTPVCPRAVCGGDFCDCIDDCPPEIEPGVPDDRLVAGPCYNKFIPTFTVYACSAVPSIYRDETISNPFGLQLYYCNPCIGPRTESWYSRIAVGPENRWYGYIQSYKYEPEICGYDETIPRIFISGCPEDPRTFPPKASPKNTYCRAGVWHGYGYGGWVENTEFGASIPCWDYVTREITYS